MTGEYSVDSGNESGVLKEQKKASWLITPEGKVPRSMEELQTILAEAQEPSPARYYPLTSTMRLYAGWLLAWYFALYALAGYQVTRSLPFRFPLLDDVLSSTLVAQISMGLFLFLLLTSLHRALRGGVLLGITLTFFGVILALLFAVNIQ